MEIITFDSVTKIDKEHVECIVNGKKIVRMFRKHTKKIREDKKTGRYCFEIQGILYYYCFDSDGSGWQYKKPEEFRNGARKSNLLICRKERNYITAELPEPIKKPYGASQGHRKQEEKEAFHYQYETIKTCIENNIPVYLYGPAGSGKNHVLDQISWDLGLEFYYTNSVQQEYKLTGFIDAGGIYHETEFYKAFKNGGLFFLDEMDASIPEVLVLLNAAISNHYFEFPCGRIEAHKNFRVAAAGNTAGSGADEQYTGRMVLDMATLDRFVMIPFSYDETIELHLAEGNKELVDFIHKLRNKAEQYGIHAVFSYRCILNVAALEKVMKHLSSILGIAVFKGMELDTVRGFCGPHKGKYWDALEELCRNQ